MDKLPGSDSIPETVEVQTTPPTGPALFWVIFPFVAIQALLALIINISRNAGLFLLLPVVSVIFCVITIRDALPAITLVSSKAVVAILIIMAYLLATGFFFITAIFVGGLPG